MALTQRIMMAHAREPEPIEGEYIPADHVWAHEPAGPLRPEDSDRIWAYQ